jgi:nucleotide-binding universal stress UspA family protein
MRIIAAIDESEAGQHVLEVIGGWARSTAVDVDLLCVIDPDKIHETVSHLTARHELTPGATWSGTATNVFEPSVALAEDRTQAMERARATVSEVLARVASQHLASQTPSIRVEFAEDTAAAICDYAVERGAAAIAIGTRGRSQLRAALFGSVSEEVIRKSTVPVLVIRLDTPVPNLAS